MMPNMGWECPKCGGCFAPHIIKCTECVSSTVTVASSWPAPTPYYIPPNQQQTITVAPTQTCPDCGQHQSSPPLTACKPWNHNYYAFAGGLPTTPNGTSWGSGTVGASAHISSSSAFPDTEVKAAKLSWAAQQLQNKLDADAKAEAKDDIPF